MVAEILLLTLAWQKSICYLEIWSQVWTSCVETLASIEPEIYVEVTVPSIFMVFVWNPWKWQVCHIFLNTVGSPGRLKSVILLCRFTLSFAVVFSSIAWVLGPKFQLKSSICLTCDTNFMNTEEYKAFRTLAFIICLICMYAYPHDAVGI